MTEPRDARPDELLERYADAVAQDPRRPSDRVRSAARAHAQMLRDQAASVQRLESGASNKPAANLPQWQLSLVASLAVVGLTGLLYVQIDRGAPQDRELALGIPAPTPGPGPAQPAQPAQTSRVDAQPLPPSPAPPADAAVVATRKETLPASKAQPLKDSAHDVATVASAKADSAAPAEADKSRQLANKLPEQLSNSGAPVAAMAPVAPVAPAAPAPAAQAIAPPPSPSPPSPSPPSVMRSARESSSTNPATAQFLVAVQTGRVDTVQKLLANGIAINTRLENGNTALMVAVVHQQAQVVRLLLSLGADTTLVNQQGLTARQIANQMGLTDMAELLQTSP